jgi:translation initiation factor 1
MPGKSDPPDSKTPFHNPFAALGQLRKDLPSANTPAAQPEPTPPARASKSAPPSIPRAVVRLERTGRGGKEVTVIDHLDVRNRDEWLKALKAALGCGGVVEGDRLVLQGDHRERLRTILAARGVKKVTVS